MYWRLSANWSYSTALGRAKRGRADEKKKPGLKFNPGLALFGLQATIKQLDLEQFCSFLPSARYFPRL